MVFFQIISFGLIAFTAGLFAFFVLTSGKNDKLSRSFLIVSLYVALWAAPIVLCLMTENGDSALRFFQVSIIFSLLIPAGFFSFATNFIESITHIDYSRYRKIVYIVGIFFAALLVSDILGFTKLILPTVSEKWWFPYWADAGPIFKYSLVYFFGTFGISFYLLLRLVRSSQDKILKGQLKFILIGVIIAMFGGSTNYFLWYDVRIPPFGNILVPIYVISMFYAIARYQLFNIKVITAQLVTFSIWSFLFFRIFFANTTREFVADASLLLLVIFFGMFLIKSVLNEVKRKEQLQIITTELKNLTGHLQEKVDEQTREIRRSYEVEKEARMKLEELGKTKDQFILSAQSRLVTPLEDIQRYLNELKGISLVPEATEDVDKITASAERLNSLIDEFVAISELRIGKGALNKKSTNLQSVIEEIIRGFKIDISKKHLKTSLIFPLKEADSTFNVDKEKIKEALTNLIDNAIKYNQEGGYVTIKGERTRHPIERDKLIYRLTIKDAGIGISSEELPRLFTQYFQRGKEAEKIYTTGRGIGLAVTKNIIESHNGRVYAESEGKSKGSKFTVELLV